MPKLYSQNISRSPTMYLNTAVFKNMPLCCLVVVNADI